MASEKAPLEVFYRVGPLGWVESAAALQGGQPAAVPLDVASLPSLGCVRAEIHVTLDRKP